MKAYGLLFNSYLNIKNKEINPVKKFRPKNSFQNENNN